MSEIRSRVNSKEFLDHYDAIFRGVGVQDESLPECEVDWSYRKDALVIKTVDGDIVIGGENGKRGRSSF
jgi:hypothetical protein